MTASASPVSTPHGMTEWYHPCTILMPRGTTPETAVHGVTSHAAEHLVIANLTTHDVTANITYFFEDDQPLQRTRVVPGRGSTIYRLHKLPGESFPMRKLFGFRITSDGPILPQTTWGGVEETKPGLYPGSFEFSAIAYPGPLGRRETKWVYADGHPLLNPAHDSHCDYEWLTILNPNDDADANVRIRFNYVQGLSETKEHSLTVPKARVRTVPLHDLPLPVLTGAQAFYPVVESDVPVIVHQTRRSAINSNPAPRGGWGLIAFPIGDNPPTATV